MAQSIPLVVGQSGLIANQQANSTSRTLDNDLDFSYVQTIDTNGWPDTFLPANLNCTLIRVGAVGSTPVSGYSWAASGDTKIAHNLGVLPTGFIVVYKDKTCDVFAGTTKSDTQFLYLKITDDTANTTLLIF